MDIKLIYYFLLLFSCLGFSKQSKLGQVSLGNYYGPNLALYHFDTKLKKNISHDDYFEKWYFQSKMQSEFFNLNDYFQGEFLTGHYCPDTVFDKHEYYYRYLVRLLSISYLYEAIREYQFTAKQMGHPEICRPVWEKVFSSCRPKTKDMQEFKTNIKHFIKNIKDVIIPYEMSKVAVREKWFVDINQSRIQTLTQARFAAESKIGKLKTLQKMSNFKKRMSNICENDLNMLNKVCSEEDSLFGVSDSLEVYALLSRSDSLKSINPKQYQLGCLKRFIQENQRQESNYLPLNSIFTHLYSRNMTQEPTYQEGHVFVFGALKEFTDKGLTSIFMNEKEVISLKAPSKITAADTPVEQKITIPILTTKTVKKKKKVLLKKKIPIQKTSAFFEAAIFRKKNKLDQVSVDMNQFHFDYIFTLKQEKQFNSFVTKFSSQKSLKDMRKNDKLGSKKAPLPLKFLKFLMDKERHKGLFNIIHVIGVHFYVLNDIDPGDQVDLVKMQNNKETHFKWQLSIIKEGTSSH